MQILFSFEKIRIDIYSEENVSSRAFVFIKIDLSYFNLYIHITTVLSLKLHTSSDVNKHITSEAKTSKTFLALVCIFFCETRNKIGKTKTEKKVRIDFQINSSLTKDKSLNF